MTVAKHL